MSPRVLLTWFKDMGGRATGVTVGISQEMGVVFLQQKS